MADDLDAAAGTGHKGSILNDPEQRSEPRAGLIALLPNALTGSRFALAILWIAMTAAGAGEGIAFAVIATAAAATDFIDGRIARRLAVAYGGGGWLDSVADVTFVLAALGCYAARGEVPWAIPVLIALSFSQYTIDSLWMHRAGAPVRSRLGHWGGIINYALVLALAFTASWTAAHAFIASTLPIIELFYIAAIIERALQYRRPNSTSSRR